jgi:hypothetical protein
MFGRKPKADDILSAFLLEFFSVGSAGPEYDEIFQKKPYSLTQNILENLYFVGFINGLMLIVLQNVLPSKGIMTVSVIMRIWERVLGEFFGNDSAIKIKQIHHAHTTDTKGSYKEGLGDAASYFGLATDSLNPNFVDANLQEARKFKSKESQIEKFLELTIWKRIKES